MDSVNYNNNQKAELIRILEKLNSGLKKVIEDQNQLLLKLKKVKKS